MSAWQFDVCVVGTGRVGLPLALVLLEQGLAVVGVDTDAALREIVNAGRMPFSERGFESVLERRALRVVEDASVAARSRSIVVCTGTPVHPHLEADLGPLERVLNELRPHLAAGQLLCLRSTLAPGSTRWAARWLEAATGLRVGHDLLVAYCPERTAEGKAREELPVLPQVVGAEDDPTFQAAAALFSRLGCEVLRADWIGAELCKLFTNANRYVQFAIANQFALLCDRFGADIHQVRHLVNHRYPRHGIESPGLTGGPCLRKDFAMLSEWQAAPDLFLAAWRVNEAMPLHLVEQLTRRLPLAGRRVAVLGYAFKRETDDLRESLVPKLVRYLRRELPAELRISEPYLSGPLPDGTPNLAADEAVRGADAVFLAMNHPPFRDLVPRLPSLCPDAWLVDPWDLTGRRRMVVQARELG